MLPVVSVSLSQDWGLSHPKQDIKIPVNLPNSVFASLITHQVINDPFIADNEQKVQWVYKSSWIYQKTFTIDEDLLKYPNIHLILFGIDTIADIYLNDLKLGTTDNMFRKYVFSIKNKLNPTKNHLKIVIHSPTNYVEQMMQQFGKLDNQMDTIPGVAYIRKAQYSFGWDWGSKLPDIGIWKPISLLAYDSLKIESIYIHSEINLPNDLTFNWKQNFNAKIYVDLTLKGKSLLFRENTSFFKHTDLTLKIKLISPTQDNSIYSFPITTPMQQFTVTIKKPKLWWPHDLGAPNLYHIEIQLQQNKEILDHRSYQIGIRQIKLIQESDQWGKSFYFQINGIPLFAKGANWIPVDTFIPRGQKAGLYQKRLQDMKTANMNCVRVWGGGIYESDEFYDLCDQLGIIVWQDFMFACSFYPYHQSFWNSVHSEVKDNIRRLRNHPSLALWCGNNEIEYLWLFYGYKFLLKGQWQKYYRYKHTYKQFFEIYLPDILQKLDPSRAYWPSSPSNGGTSTKHGIFRSNSPNRGDSHFWKVWHLNAPFSAYKKFNSRFMSEFGFESFPSLLTIDKFCPPDQKDVFSNIMEQHQKNDAGNQKLVDYAKRRFRWPSKFKHQIMLSQITQAEAIEYGVIHWRQNRNQQHCMGTLYWQLNDCWPVTSWSSIDYYGRWKALHYYAKRFFQPILPVVDERKKYLILKIINDKPTHFRGNLVWEIRSLTGTLIFTSKKNIELPESCVTPVVKISKRSLKGYQISTNQYYIYLQLNLNPKQLKSNHQNYSIKTSRNLKPVDYFYLPFTPKKIHFKDPLLTWSMASDIKIKIKSDCITWSVSLISQKPAFYVHLSLKQFDFQISDNFFHLQPQKEKIIKITIKITDISQKINIIEKNAEQLQSLLKKNIEIYSIFDLQN